ncbi:hypothetical protein WN943_001243 [Citrus x changshan-huyou]
MASSEDKIMAIMDYFVRKMGCKALFVAECPSLTTFSLEKKRIVPRGSVAQGLLSKVLIKNDLGLSTLFHTSEKLFLKSPMVIPLFWNLLCFNAMISLCIFDQAS